MTSTTPQDRILDCRPSLAGKVAFVAGGLGGIGRACVHALAAHGARVAFTWSDSQESAERARALVAERPDDLSAHPLDLRASASIERALRDAAGRWGRVDILVNAAAVGSATVDAYAPDAAGQDTAMLTINADGALKLCQAFLALNAAELKTAPLKIINFSSVGGGIAAFAGFRLSDGMSKAAVAFLTRQLAAELTDTQVDVFALCPGATNTGMFQASTLNGMTAAERSEFIASLPRGRLIEPDEIADLVVFLASAYSAPLHGAVIDASLGLGVRPGIMTERGH